MLIFVFLCSLLKIESKTRPKHIAGCLFRSTYDPFLWHRDSSVQGSIFKTSPSLKLQKQQHCKSRTKNKSIYIGVTLRYALKPVSFARFGNGVRRKNAWNFSNYFLTLNFLFLSNFREIHVWNSLNTPP